MRVRKLPKRVLDLFPMWEYRCPICHTYVELSTNICPRCRTLFDEKKWRVPPRFLATKKAMSDYAHNVLARGLDEEQRELLFRHFTELFSDGFESGNFSAWTDTEVHGDATLTVVSDQKHHGTYSAKAYVTGSDGRYATCYKDFTTQTTLYYRGYFRFNELPSSGNEIGPILSARTSDGNDWAKVYAKNDAGQMQWKLVNDDAAATHTYDATINAGQWYCVELKTTKGSPGNLQLYIDNDKIIDETESFNRDIARIQVGLSWYTQANTMWFDCFVLADAGPIGMEGETDLSSNFKVQKTFGKVAIGGSNQARSADFAFAVGGTGGYFTLNEPGEVTKIRIYCRSGTEADNKKACIYAVDAGGLPTTLKGVSAEVEVPVSPAAWYDFAFSPAVFLTAGNYRLGWNSESQALYVWFDSGDADAAKYKSSTYPNFPNPFGTPDGGSDREYSIYALYTPSQLASANLSSTFNASVISGSKDLSSTVAVKNKGAKNLNSTFRVPIHIALVVGNSASLTAKETAIKSRYEGWGWNVVVKDDGLAADSWDPESFAGVIISQSVNSADVIWMCDEAVGFLCYEGYLNDDFDMGTGVGTVSAQTTINIVDNTHYITSPYSTGNLVVSSSDVYCWVSGWANDVNDLAQQVGDATHGLLLEIDKGEDGVSGSPVPERRVYFGVDSHDIGNNLWNSDGWNIFDRALRWITYEETYEANLSSNFYVGGKGSKDLSSNFFVGGLQADSTNLSSTFFAVSESTISTFGENLDELVVVEEATEDLTSSFAIQKPGSADVSSTFIVGQGYADLSSNFTIGLTADSTDLSSQFIVQQLGSKDLSSTFVISKSSEKDLSSSFTIQKPDEANLTSTFVVQQPGESNLSSQFVVQQTDEATLQSTFIVQTPGEVDLSSTIFIYKVGEGNLSSTLMVRNVGEADLSSTFHIGGIGSADLSSTFTLPFTDSADLSSVFTIIQPGEANLSLTFTIQKPDEVDLSSTFTILTPDETDLSSQFIVRSIGEKNLSSTFIVRNVGEADLSSTCVVLNIGEQDLSATFIVQQPSEKDLSSTFTIITPGEADLSSTLDVQRPGEVDLSSTFIVGQGYADLSSNFFVGKLEGSADLSSNFEVQQPGEANLSANFKVITRIVSDYKDNLDELEVYEVASKDLTSNVTVRNIASATLSGSFVVQQPGSADLSSNFVVFYFWKDLPANFIVVPYVVETKLFDDQTTDIALIDAETTTVTLRDYAKAKEMLRHY